MGKVSWMILFLIVVFAGVSANAQEKYWVCFNAKTKPTVLPHEYLSARTLERRMALEVNLLDPTDWPVDTQYIQKVESCGATTGYPSRWLNAVAVAADKKAISKIEKLPFVKEILPMQYFAARPASYDKEMLPAANDELPEAQLKCLQAQEFISRGINGKGVRIAVFDGGFPGVDTNPVFAHLWDNKQIVKTFDFVRKKENVYGDMTHGTGVLSCIAGKYNGKNIGLATGAEFLLARTEIKPEVKAEEEYWMAAMEWADQNGADIISSSLGYTDKRYSVMQMNGRSTLVTKAAAIAARKGMLVINAMGNDGQENWEVMGAPADADSVLSIGGIDPFKGYHVSFSSFGPTADFRRKPNLCAPGIAMVASPGSIKKGYGTSYSTPLVAGFAACAWQLNRTKNSMEIFRLLEQSGHLFPYFDYAHGYGIPQASFFFKNENVERLQNPIKVERVGEAYQISVTEVEEKVEDYRDYLYYHIQRPDGVLRYYAVLDVYSKDVTSVSLSKMQNGDVLRVYYKGFITETKYQNHEQN